jgi:putative nucleotidyltransferase with HDIG domain
MAILQQLYHDPQWWAAANKMRGWSECLFRHSLAVADLALQVGRELGLPEDECQMLRAGGFLHDLGKVAWPRCLVDKAPLNDLDWRIVRVHPLVGAELAREWGCCRDETVLRIIREHHAYGANGYPEKIGELHPLSRIVIAAEVYAALTEPRPYRPLPLLPRDALRLLSNDGHGPEVLAALGRAC